MPRSTFLRCLEVTASVTTIAKGLLLYLKTVSHFLHFSTKSNKGHRQKLTKIHAKPHIC